MYLSREEWGLRLQAGDFTPSTPEIILHLIAPGTARREYGYHSGSLRLPTPQLNGYWTYAIVH
ncbi:hypothetical protein [Leptothermofonsia sp. ETS-13]|uniref:hypothetical protein n=1 Tax=Leptothermofonsia sp. ETS-13 TaxID=3035696 RepID=UPI003BA0395C